MKERKLKINLKLINYFYILLQTNRFIYKKKKWIVFLILCHTTKINKFWKNHRWLSITYFNHFLVFLKFVKHFIFNNYKMLQTL